MSQSTIIIGMNETDFAYAAGYIDGDGCFQIGNNWASHLVITSVSKPSIMWFAESFDGHLRCQQRDDGIRRPAFYFRFSEKGLKFLTKIHPYLVEKKEESSIFQRFREFVGKSEKTYVVEEMRRLKNKSNLINYSIKSEIEQIRNTIKPTIEDFAYLAGFVDAECSIDINRRMQTKGKTFTYRPQLQCNNTKAPFFYWASKRFGGQFHFLDKTHIPRCRNQMLWRISNAQLDPILEGIYPFLKTKKEICAQLMELRKSTFSKKRTSPNHPKFMEIYGPIAEAREVIYHKVRHLNKIT
jgi:hypothetical protein